MSTRRLPPTVTASAVVRAVAAARRRMSALACGPLRPHCSIAGRVVGGNQASGRSVRGHQTLREPGWKYRLQPRIDDLQEARVESVDCRQRVAARSRLSRGQRQRQHGAAVPSILRQEGADTCRVAAPARVVFVIAARHRESEDARVSDARRETRGTFHEHFRRVRRVARGCHAISPARRDLGQVWQEHHRHVVEGA